MVAVRGFAIVVLACLVALVGASSDSEKFKQLKEAVFGMEDSRLMFFLLEEHLASMIELLKTGHVSADAQGSINLDYLEKLVADCDDSQTCNLEEDMARVARLRGRETGSPDLHTYLSQCSYRIVKRCAHDAYSQASKKVSNVDEKVFTVLQWFAKEVEKSKLHDSRLDSAYFLVILNALQKAYPQDWHRLAGKWTNKEKSLRKFMDRVRSSCVSFLDNYDPIVELYPKDGVYVGIDGTEPMEVLPKWHFYVEHCRRIVNQWEKIVQDAEKNYEVYFKDSKYDFNIVPGDRKMPYDEILSH